MSKQQMKKIIYILSNNNNNYNSNGNRGSSIVDTTGLPLEWGHGFDPQLQAPIIKDDSNYSHIPCMATTRNCPKYEVGSN